jgi:hypothetical protein
MIKKAKGCFVTAPQCAGGQQHSLKENHKTTAFRTEARTSWFGARLYSPFVRSQFAKKDDRGQACD